GYDAKLTNKGNVKLFIEGKDHSKKRATSAHVDTLGLMVRSIKGDGTLAVTNVGGPSIPTLDGEYCKIMTRDGKVYSGTILCSSASVHVYEDAKNKPRDIDSMIVRIDEKVNSKDDVEKLGIDNGDYIFIDPKTTLTPSGFLKSRFIDDKGSVCAILGVLKELKEKNMLPAYDTVVYFVNQEEVGHGAATIDTDIDEFVTVDMGCIGKDLAGNEYAVSICAKDSGGPYSYELTTKLIQMAKENNFNYVVDIFPFYGSDIGAAWRSGVDCAGALIGPGVHASHGMERTHLEAIENTMKLLYLYLTTK
ncbi:MAG: M42 family metallopeptidase, partial [Anaeroplasmataceae bacterium]|nr:M42 family metallopeptidase [Anaeroplasmataceae bacterium]